MNPIPWSHSGIHLAKRNACVRSEHASSARTQGLGYPMQLGQPCLYVLLAFSHMVYHQ